MEEKYSIRKEIFIRILPEELFKLLTDANEIIQYYPLKSVFSNWEVGSEILFKGEIDGHEFTDFGTIEKLEKNKIFQYRYWSDNHGTSRTPENHLTICYTLSEFENGTSLTLEQSNLNAKEMHQQMIQVWDFLLSSLKDYAESK